MADKRQNEFNKDKGMGAGTHDKKNQSQNAPGRGVNDNLSTGGRSGSGVQGSERGLDREDREREQPGSKQKDRGQNY